MIKQVILKKTIVSSTIKTTVQDLTSVAYGDFYVKNVIVKSDSTGLAGGTNFTIKSDNANGLANILVEAVANLGANKTVDMSSASVTKQPTVLESGKKLQFLNTAAVGTGAGTVDIYMVLEKVTPNSNILVA